MPYENYRKVFRTSQKHIERELGAIHTAANELATRVQTQSAEGDEDEIMKALDGMLKRAEHLKRKVCHPVISEHSHRTYLPIFVHC